jgi:hypothetical protein
VREYNPSRASYQNLFLSNQVLCAIKSFCSARSTTERCVCLARFLSRAAEMAA